MPVDPAKKKAPSLQLLELPMLKTVADVVVGLNVRFRELNTALKSVLTNPAKEESPWNLSYNRITYTGDPRDDLDVVNLRTLRRYVSPRPVTQQAETTGASDPVVQYYTQVFTFDGQVTDDQKSPSFTVNEFRTGRIFKASLTAELAPSSEPLKVNFLFLFPGESDPTPLFLEGSELSLDEGEKGPILAVQISFEIARNIPDGTKVRMHIVQAGLAEQVVGEILIKVGL